MKSLRKQIFWGVLVVVLGLIGAVSWWIYLNHDALSALQRIF